MPIGYLTPLILLAVCTLAALLPPRHFGAVGRLSFYLSVAINEVPHLAAVALLAATALAWAQGDLGGWRGGALAAFAGLVLVGLLELLRRGLMARPAMEAEVRSQGAEPRRVRGSLRRATFFPFPWRPRTVARSGRIAYGPHRRQWLDVYHTRNGEHRGPVLVYLHGGAYSSGSNRREGKALIHHLVSQGWVCISANYRLRPSATFADHLADARAVLRWAHTHARDHGGDTGLVVMAGSSAGAHLTSLCALTQDAADPDRPRVDAAVCLYPWVGRYFGRGPDEITPSTPMALDPVTAPPFFIAHGDHDSWVPIDEVRHLRNHLSRRSGNPVWFVELPGAQHGFDALQSWRSAAVIEGLEAFLGHVLPLGEPATKATHGP